MAGSKDDELKIQNMKKNLEDTLAREAMDATALSRQRAKDLRMQNDLDIIESIRRGAFTKGENGQDIAWWDKLGMEAHRAIHSEQNAYNDWRSAMMSLLSMFSTMVNALNNTVEQATGPLSMQVKQAIREHAMVPFKNFIIDKAWGDQVHDIPALLHSVNFSDDDKLMIGNLSRADNGVVTDELNAPYRTLTTLWLETHGYKPDAPDLGADGVDKNIGRYVNDDGVLLSKAVFDELKNHPEFSLNAFLQQKSGLEFAESPTPTPSM